MKTSYRIPGLILLVSSGLLLPAFAGKVKTVLAPNTNMASYKTYRWLPPKVLGKAGVEENNPANPVLKAVVNTQLERVGLKEVADGGDLEIQAFVCSAHVPQLEAVLMGEGYNFDYGTIVATMGRYNREGSLYLNLIDVKTKKSAWAGMVTDSLKSGYLSPEDIRSKLDKAATDIFKKYPGKK